MRMEFDTRIEAPPDRVWPWLVETERMQRWMAGLESVEPLTPGGPRVGARARMAIREGGRLATYESELLECAEPRLLALALTGAHWKGLSMRVRYELVKESGGTRLRYACECVTDRTLYRVMFKLFGWFAKRQAKSFMQKLKSLAEARPG